MKNSDKLFLLLLILSVPLGFLLKTVKNIYSPSISKYSIVVPVINRKEREFQDNYITIKSLIEKNSLDPTGYGLSCLIFNGLGKYGVEYSTEMMSDTNKPLLYSIQEQNLINNCLLLSKMNTDIFSKNQYILYSFNFLLAVNNLYGINIPISIDKAIKYFELANSYTDDKYLSRVITRVSKLNIKYGDLKDVFKVSLINKEIGVINFSPPLELRYNQNFF
jgi:hypothetical protein